MLDQSFSTKSLKRLLRKEDVAKFRLWRPGDDKDSIVARLAANINSPAFAFPPFREKRTKKRIVYSSPDADTALALRKLDRNIRSIYKVKQADRNAMIHQVKSLLQEACSFSVLRLDIASFYESIDRQAVLDKLATDALVSYLSRDLLRRLFATPQFAAVRGVPRGLAVSATLSELFLRDADRAIRTLPTVYFYGRYVDDIIVFTYDAVAEVEGSIAKALSQAGLKLNPDKRTLVTCSGDINKDRGNGNEFDFLGYRLKCREFLRGKDDWRDVSAGIAKAKMRKIKTRIARSFVSFIRSSDFDLLEKRLRFICGNHRLKRNSNGILYGGLFYNYQHLSDMSDLDDLTQFLRRMAFARRGSIGTKLNSKLTPMQRRRLGRLSFRAAFGKRLAQSISREDMRKVRQCWIYEKN